MSRLNFLHLTDSHIGSSEHPTSWASVKDEFFKDLEGLVKETGPIELVLFSGDLTSKGSPAEFRDFDSKLWLPLKDALQSFNQSLHRRDVAVQLIAVPGNHDLRRPTAKHAWQQLLEGWINFTLDRDGIPENRVLREMFLGDPAGWDAAMQEAVASYRPVEQGLRAAFDAYEEWWGATRAPLGEQLVCGKMPGDFLHTYESHERLSLLVIGLNSSYLQLAAGNYHERLSLDARQLNALCAGDPAARVRRHHFSLLMTHHPPAWLHDNDRRDFYNSIHKPDWFHAHVYGHKNLPSSRAHSQGGSLARIEWQGASLCGSERFDTYATDGKSQHGERVFGYCLGSFIANGDVGELWQYPRRATLKQSGRMGFGPDSSFELSNDRFVRLPVRPHRAGPADIDGVGAATIAARASEPATETGGSGAPRSTEAGRPANIEQEVELWADTNEFEVPCDWEKGLQQLDRELLGQRLCGVVTLIGSPGQGKSELLRAFWRRHKPNGDLTLVFCNLGRPERRTTEAVRRIVAEQLRHLAPEGDGLGIEALLGLASRRLRLPEQRVIVIYDGLDRIEDLNALRQLLPPVLPEGILMLAAMRPRFPHKHLLAQRADGIVLDLWLSSDAACEAALRALQLPPSDLESASRLCGGNVQVVHHLIRHLSEQPTYGRNVPAELPSLHGTMEEHWRQLRLLPEPRWERALSGLAYLSITEGPLQIDVLAPLAGWSNVDTKDQFLEDVGPWIELYGNWHCQLYHPLFRRFVQSKLGKAWVASLLLRCAEFFGRWPFPAELQEAEDHALLNAVKYQLDTGPSPACLDRALELVTNVSFLTKQLYWIGADWQARQLEQLAPHGPPHHRDLLLVMAQVERREADLLRSRSEGLPSVLQSRLLCAGWTAEQLDGLLSFPTEKQRLQLRLPLTGQNASIERIYQVTDAHGFGLIEAYSYRRFWIVSGDEIFERKLGDELGQRQVAKLPIYPRCLASALGYRVALCGGRRQDSWEVWLLTENKLVKLGEHSTSITMTAVSFTCELGVSIDGAGGLKLWDLVQQREISGSPSGTLAMPVTCCAFAADGWLILGTTVGGLVAVLLDLQRDARTNQIASYAEKTKTFVPAQTEHGVRGVPCCCVISRDSTWVACGLTDGTVGIWDWPSGTVRNTLQLPGQSKPRKCMSSANGSVLLIQSNWGLGAWDTEKGNQLWWWPTGTLRDFTLLGEQIVTVDGRRQIEAWRPLLQVQHTARDADVEHQDEVASCLLAEGARTALSCAWNELKDRSPLLWQLSGDPERKRLTGLPTFRSGCRLGSSRLLLVGEDGALTVVQSSDWTILQKLSITGSRFVCSADQKWLLLIQTQAAAVWEVDRLLAGETDPIYHCTAKEFGGDSGFLWQGALTAPRHLAVITDVDGGLWHFDWQSKRRPKRLNAYADFVRGCAFSPNGRLLATAGEQGELTIWDLYMGPQPVPRAQRLRGHERRVNGLLFLNDQELISIGGEDATIRRWNLASGSCAEVFCGTAPFFQLDYLDGLLCVGDRNGAVWFIDVAPRPS